APRARLGRPADRAPRTPRAPGRLVPEGRARVGGARAQARPPQAPCGAPDRARARLARAARAGGRCSCARPRAELGARDVALSRENGSAKRLGRSRYRDFLPRAPKV